MVSFSSTIEVGETPALAQDRARHLNRVNTMTVGDMDMDMVAMMKTRLTYNCAHLRSTKESLIFKYFDTGRYWLVFGQYRTVRVDI